MVASRWPRVTWSAGRTTTSATRPSIVAATTCSIFIASRVTTGSPAATACADRGVDREDGAGHRGDELDRPGRPGRAMGDGRAGRRVDVGRGRQRERDASAGEVEMDGVARADGRDRMVAGEPRARRPAGRSRRPG